MTSSAGIGSGVFEPIEPRWILTFDVGGTFTDLILVDTEGKRIHAAKVPTTAENMSVGIGEGVIRLLEHEVPVGVPMAFRGATTLIGNLLHERKGSRVGLLVTRGFRDILTIRREYRYDLYDLRLRFPDPLVDASDIHEVDERMGPRGEIIKPPDREQIDAIAQLLREAQVESVAVCFLHSYADHAHEQQVADWLRAAGFTQPITLSGRLVPEAREYERAATTVANAYVVSGIREQIEDTGNVLRDTGHSGDLHLMFSNGGFSSLDHALNEPIHLVESGPAAGVVAAGRLRKRLGIEKLLTFEMGGTTAKMSLLRGDKPDVVTECEVARTSRFRRGSGIPLKIRAVDLLEIGAGGGSIARVENRRLLVGPASAGSDPGPACYGWGGTHATVTDADLILGYLNPDFFLAGQMKLEGRAAEEALQQHVAKPLGITVVEAALAVRTIADENLAVATRVHFAEKGADPRQYTLAAFGGAGPTHFDTIAERLGITRVVVPELPGVASAVGLAIAPLAVHLVRTYFTAVERIDWDHLNGLLADMEREATQLLTAAGARPEDVTLERTADMRYRGQGYEISVGLPPGELSQASCEEFNTRFSTEYRRLFRREVPGLSLEALAWRAAAYGPPFVGSGDAWSWTTALAGRDPRKGTRPVHVSTGSTLEAVIYDRNGLEPGRSIDGPAVVEEAESTVWVPPGWTACTSEFGGHLIVEASRSEPM